MAIDPGDTSATMWLMEQLDAVGRHIREGTSSKDSNESDINDCEGE